MSKTLFLLPVLSLSFLLSGCNGGENADMPKDDPIIGKPVAGDSAKTTEGVPSPATAGKPSPPGKGTPLGK